MAMCTLVLSPLFVRPMPSEPPLAPVPVMMNLHVGGGDHNHSKSGSSITASSNRSQTPLSLHLQTCGECSSSHHSRAVGRATEPHSSIPRTRRSRTACYPHTALLPLPVRQQRLNDRQPGTTISNDGGSHPAAQPPPDPENR